MPIIDNNLLSKNAFVLRRFSFLQAHYFLISKVLSVNY